MLPMPPVRSSHIGGRILTMMIGAEARP